MSLPTFIVLKSNYKEKYLGYVPPEEFKDIHQGVEPSRNSFLRFDRDEVSKCTKFKVKPAKIGDGLVHLKSCYNNKYWVRWSPNHWWIVAAADQPEEDQSKWSCTLFKLEYIEQNANTVRFIHLQLGHYACLWRIDPPFGDCLFAGSKDPDKDTRDVVTVIDWEALPSKRLKAVVYPLTSNNGVIGRIDFTQQDKNTPVDIEVNISNILDGLHALHINTYGDISDGPRKTEPIFGYAVCICPPVAPIGKLQDVEAVDGIVNVHMTSDKISLFPGENCIIGRAVVVYAGSTTDGIGDAIIAWGIIGLSP